MPGKIPSEEVKIESTCIGRVMHEREDVTARKNNSGQFPGKKKKSIEYQASNYFLLPF